MGSRIQIEGNKFGRLTVIREAFARVAPSGNRILYFATLCECGNTKIVRGSKLRIGATKSCGCIRIESLVARCTTHGSAPRGKVTSEYHCWNNLIQRCSNPRIKNYADYGGRGIKVCDRWLNSFEVFLADVGKKPTPQHTIDRINNDGNYEPGNCRWATRTVQARNRRLRMKRAA